MERPWRDRLRAIRATDDDEHDRLSEAYDNDWKAAYCAEFRRFAAGRGWSQENIDSGWLDDMPESAIGCYERGADPTDCARRDVPDCEGEE